MNNKKIILGKQYKLDMGQHVTVIPRRVLADGIECEYVMSSPNRKELIKYNIWEMNGFDVSDYSLMWLGVEYDTERTNPESNYKVGDKILVCGELETEITKVEYVYGEWIYYFKDENNETKFENESAIKKISQDIGIDAEEVLMGMLRDESPSQKDVIEEVLNKKANINTTQANIKVINETVDDVNYNVESEAIRLTSSHYKLQRGLWSWKYGDEVEKDSWEMAKQHASNTAEENVKQAVINELGYNIIDFWFDVIRKIEKI